MECHLDTVHQRSNAAGHFRGRAGAEMLQSERQADKGAEDTKTGHHTGDLVQHIAVHNGIHDTCVDVVLDIALVVRLFVIGDAVQLKTVILESLQQVLFFKKLYPARLIGLPQELVRVQRIAADLFRRLVQVGDDSVHGEETADLTLHKDQSHDQEHHAVDDDIGCAFFLTCRQVQPHAKRDHRKKRDRQKPLIPFSVMHIFSSEKRAGLRR